MAKTTNRATAAQSAAAGARRVRFVLDEEAYFEESNGESRSLTEAEYAENQYMGCPTHPREPGDGSGTCPRCGLQFAPLSYEEYLAYYGNPDRHVYLGCIVEQVCPTCGESAIHHDAVWGIDFMDDSRELHAITIGQYLTEAEARALPGYAGDVARDLLGAA
jgi:hypothetical protein